MDTGGLGGWDNQIKCRYEIFCIKTELAFRIAEFTLGLITRKENGERGLRRVDHLQFPGMLQSGDGGRSCTPMATFECDEGALIAGGWFRGWRVKKKRIARI